MKYFNFKGTITGAQYAGRYVLALIAILVPFYHLMERTAGTLSWISLVVGFAFLISSDIKRFRSVFPDTNPWACLGIMFLANFLMQAVLPDAIADIPGVLFTLYLIFENGKIQKDESI